MRVQRQSLALVNFIVERQRPEDHQYSIDRIGKLPHLVRRQLRYQSAIVGHHDVVAAREHADRARIADDRVAAIDHQLEPLHQRDELVPQVRILTLGARLREHGGKRLRRSDDLLMQMRLRRARLAPLVLADHDRANVGILQRQPHHARIGLHQMKEMPAAQRAGKHQIGLRSRRVDKMTRIFDHDVRLVAISGQLRGNSREEIVDHAHDPTRAVGSLRRRSIRGFHRASSERARASSCSRCPDRTDTTRSRGELSRRLRCGASGSAVSRGRRA